MESLDNLRNQVARKQRAASAKVSRLTRAGINVPASGIDPRRDVSRVKNYNRIQLTSYLAQLNRFTERTNQWIPGKGGIAKRPGLAEVRERTLPKRFEALRAKYNAASAKHYGELSGLMTYKGYTVHERDYEVTSRRTRAMGRGSHRPMDTFETSADKYENKRLLKAHYDLMKRRLEKDYIPSAISKQRGYALQMANEIGDPTFIKNIEGLTDYQFNVLWNFTPFANEISFWYRAEQMRNEGKELERMHDSMEDSSIRNAFDGMKWAQMLPKNAVEAEERAKKKPRRRR